MSVERLVDSLARDSTSRLVAALARRLGAGRIAIAEDAVQHALLQALSSWPFKGVPDRPAAWLTFWRIDRRFAALPVTAICAGAPPSAGIAPPTTPETRTLPP